MRVVRMDRLGVLQLLVVEDDDAA